MPSADYAKRRTLRRFGKYEAPGTVCFPQFEPPGLFDRGATGEMLKPNSSQSGSCSADAEGRVMPPSDRF
jgi:hypothetical protein